MSGESQRSVILHWEDRAGCFTFHNFLFCSTYCVFSSFAIIFIREERVGCFTFTVFLMSGDSQCSAALQRVIVVFSDNTIVLFCLLTYRILVIFE